MSTLLTRQSCQMWVVHENKITDAVFSPRPLLEGNAIDTAGIKVRDIA